MQLNKIYSQECPHGVVVTQFVVVIHNINILLNIMMVHNTHNVSMYVLIICSLQMHLAYNVKQHVQANQEYQHIISTKIIYVWAKIHAMTKLVFITS